MRIAVAWPRPREHRWRNGFTAPSEFPDCSDGLLYLEDEGFHVTIEDSCGILLNPLVRVHEFYSGLDPVRAIRLAARMRRYDAAVCVGDSAAFVLVWLRQFFGLRLPIVLIDPALSYDYPRRKRLQDYVLPRVDRVVVFGRAQLTYLEQEYGPAVKATFLYHRVDTEFYQPQRDPAARRYVLSVGSDASRDYDTLALAARACANSSGFDRRFVVQTTRPIEGGDVLDVRQSVVPYPELRSLYAGADVVVVPLFDMIHPGGITTLLEAMSMACPVIASASRGLIDHIHNGEDGLVVKVGDAEAMAQAIVNLVQSPVEARRLGDNARHFVVDTCSNRRYAKNIAHVIREAVESSRRGPEEALHLRN